MKGKLNLSDMIKVQPIFKQMKDNMREKVRAVKKKIDEE